MRTRLFVPPGGAVHSSMGETSRPSAVNCAGMESPAANAGLERTKPAMIFPPIFPPGIPRTFSYTTPPASRDAEGRSETNLEVERNPHSNIDRIEVEVL